MKRGSALLIVLGMVSFLVMSAVAFSVFMRASRLPSSYALRMSSSRNLAKAGLAEALVEIENAVANNPHPGVGIGGQDADGNLLPNRNQWVNRVFLGTNTLVSVEQTVSVLTLESLAYVPAPLINEVRYYARRTAGAAWHTLGFDAGRFAFVALDVSDYFDVNRFMAVAENDFGCGGRTSASDSRITLAYLFEDASHSGWRCPPEKWDEFIGNYLDPDAGAGSSSKVPLMSVADLNLAIWDRKPAGVRSPWCEFIKNGTPFVQDDNADRQMLSNMVFVTDSYYPPKKFDKGCVNLSNGSDQPFQPSLQLFAANVKGGRGFDQVLQGVTTKSFTRTTGGGTFTWADVLAPPEMAQLCDYLDADSVPVSLALPTVERTPMVTGVYLRSNDIHVELSAGTEYDAGEAQDANGTYRYHVTPTIVRFVAVDLKAMAGLVFPFKHKRGTTTKFEAQAYATVAFVEGGTDELRPGTTGWATVPDWNADEQKAQIGSFANAGGKPSGFSIASGKVPLTVPDGAETEELAVLQDAELQFGTVNEQLASELPESSGEITGLRKDTCTFRAIQKMRKSVSTAGQVTWTPEGDPVCEFGALPAANDLGSEIAAANLTAGKKFTPTIQVWVRVTASGEAAAGATVDLVPACAADDPVPSEVLTDSTGSAKRPVLRFSDGSDKAAFTFDGKALLGGGAVALAPQAYMTDDPRFNYAPENFWAMGTFQGENGFKSEWLGKVRAGERDGDIFMATSDAGYLQSKYELMYMLRISNLNASEDWGCLSGQNYNGKARGSFDDLAADGAMWRTYTQYPVNGASDAAKLDEFNIVSDLGGPRICPYTPDTAVMMGALANTPVDWWAASTNGTETAKQGMLTDINTALKYTYSDHSAEASCKVPWRNLENLARTFISSFHNSTADWRTSYDGFDWDGALLDNLESDGVNLDSVDRKYLFGFWRDCFDTRQQLYLVFVRTEPMMMGGESVGALPPMLGARAVALVWRDPTPTANNAPHRMRVLFYRQCD